MFVVRLAGGALRLFLYVERLDCSLDTSGDYSELISSYLLNLSMTGSSLANQRDFLILNYKFILLNCPHYFD